MTTRSELTPASAGQQFTKWLASHSFNAKLCVLCHSDADGISAGAILHRTLRRSGREVATIVTQKFENAWSESVRDRVQATSPDALVVCDLGVRARPVLDAVPTCFIDHHYFSDAPLNGVVITGFQVEPCPTSGLIAFWCASAVADVARSRMDRRDFAAQRQRRTRALCGAHFREKRAWLVRTPQGDHSAERSASILKRQRAACSRVAPACGFAKRDFPG